MRVLALLIALTGCGRIGFDALGGGDDNTGDDDDDATGDGGQQGDGATTPDAFMVTGCGPTIIIDDNFADGAQGSQWGLVNTVGYTVTESGDAVTVAFPASAPANTRAGYRQNASISFTNTCAIAEVTAVPSGSTNAYAYLRLGTPTLNVELAIEAGNVLARFTNGGTSGTNGMAAYNASNHRFLRIRQAGSSYNFEVAAALTGPYQLLGSAGGAIVQPSPSSLEFGGSTTTAAGANNAGNAKFERVLFLGP